MESQKLWGSLAKAFANPGLSKFTRSLAQAFTHVERQTPSGIFLGQAPAYRVDGARVERIIAKIARGLYFHNFRVRVPANFETRVASEGAEQGDEVGASFLKLLISETKRGQPKSIGDGNVFRYWLRQFPDDPSSCFFVLCFYENVLFHVAIGPFSQFDDGSALNS